LSKPVVYIFTDWYAPGFKAGGPIQSVVNLAQLLSKENRVKIITRNTDYGSQTPYLNLESDVWILESENIEILYLSKENISIKTFNNICKLGKQNIVIINGLFSFWYSILPLFLANLYNRNKILVATRGMLHKSALSIKPTKKLMFLAFARGFGLYRKSILLATSEFEKQEIEKSLGKVKIKIAPNIPIKPIELKDIENKTFKPQGKLRLLFLGRIAPEKNPISVLKALQTINIPLAIHFIGSAIDKQYNEEFENLIKNLPENIDAKHTQEIPHAEITNLFSENDVMILPSLGENFGHAIFESLAHAVPVIIGNNTPWQNIKEQKAGIEIIPTNIEQIKEAIIYFNQIDKETYYTWQKGALNCAKNYISANNFDEIYSALIR